MPHPEQEQEQEQEQEPELEDCGGTLVIKPIIEVTRKTQIVYNREVPILRAIATNIRRNHYIRKSSSYAEFGEDCIVRDFTI